MILECAPSHGPIRTGLPPHRVHLNRSDARSRVGDQPFLRKICQTAWLLRSLRWPQAQVRSISKRWRTTADRVVMRLLPLRIAMNEAENK